MSVGSLPPRNPLGVLLDQVRGFLLEGLREGGIPVEETAIEVRRERRAFGDVSAQLSKVCAQAGKSIEELVSVLSPRRLPSMLAAYSAKNTFLNFTVNLKDYSKLVESSIFFYGDEYGSVPSGKRLKIIVEHTSANPIHPLHIGHLRNAILGDALARLLRSRGHEVYTHFYVDDVGLQVTFAALGYKVAGSYEKGKPDHFVGDVYTMVNLLLELEKLKSELRSTRDPSRVAEINAKISEYTARLHEYSRKHPEAFNKLVDEVGRLGQDIERAARSLGERYENFEEDAVKAIRSVVERCLAGIKQTLDRLSIHFDSWDWESEITVWSGATQRVIEKLVKTGLVETRDGALVFRADLLASDAEVRKKAGIAEGLVVTPMTLTRSDGTTLYVTRDIAYSEWKLARADLVVNVIAAEQTLAQAQLRLALFALGYEDIGSRLVHYSHEMVSLPGVRMSSRRGVYISADSLIDEAVSRAKAEIEKRGLGTHEDAERVGIGALKFYFLSSSPSKVLTFSWERVLDFEQNSGPFVQYSYVRAAGILQKAAEQGYDLEKVSLIDAGEEERGVLLLLGDFPDVVSRSADQLRPDMVASYLNQLAVEFNRYYDTCPVLRAPTESKVVTRLALVRMVGIVLRNGLRLLGIEPPKRM
ncbi:MAG: arginine--tRNA ligase [Thermofilum sp.]